MSLLPGYGPYYSMGPLVSSTLRADNIQHFLDDLRDALVAGANWTLNSSFAGASGTSGYILTSFPTVPNLISCKLKIFYDGTLTALFEPLISITISDVAQLFPVQAYAISISSRNG